MILLMSLAFAGTSKTLSPTDAGRAVAMTLMDWHVLGEFDTSNRFGYSDYYTALDSLVRDVKGVNGFTESDGFHGDGTDWYEVELAPDLAINLRDALHKDPQVTTGNSGSGGVWDKAPSWWPKHWRADSKCYQRGLEYFILPATGTRAWLMRVRT
jgi:hypothetical protein